MNFSLPDDNSVTELDYNLLLDIVLLIKLFQLTIKDSKREPADKSLVINCHSVARLVHLHYYPRCRIADGEVLGVARHPDSGEYFLQRTCHSWVLTPTGNIIDPYPMGTISVTNVTLAPHRIGGYAAHGFNNYRELPEDSSENFDCEKSWQDARIFKSKMDKHCTEEMVERESALIHSF